jgi:hypothetical protein
MIKRSWKRQERKMIKASRNHLEAFRTLFFDREDH